MDVLVIDVGGSHVKLYAGSCADVRRFDSASDLTPRMLVDQTLVHTRDWRYDVISLGIPGIVSRGRPQAEPGNLGSGWIEFDFEQAFGKPVRVVNDAVLQALGAYDGGRMVFLGLGTGLGSTLVTEHVVIPLELGNLPLRDGATMAQRLSRQGFKASGASRWLEDVHDASCILRSAFDADYLVLGGGNAKRVDPLPPGVRRGGNQDACTGGFRLWEEIVEPHDREPQRVWRVVR
jgi:polyphosphate glucokinase